MRPGYTRAERVIVPPSPDWVVSGALEERQKLGGRRFRIRKAKARSKIGGKYTNKSCSHKLKLLYVQI